MTGQVLNLGCPNLDQKYILALLGFLLVLSFIDLDLYFISYLKTLFTIKFCVYYSFALCCAYLVRSSPVTQTITGFQVIQLYWFYVGCLETIGAMQSRDTETCPVAVGISRTDQQISLKISVAVSYQYSHYVSVWTLWSIIDITIGLITFKKQYHLLWIRPGPGPDCAVTGYERQLVITGRQNCVTATRNRSENLSKYSFILLSRVLQIFVYITQCNWLCLNYKLVGQSPLEDLSELLR